MATALETEYCQEYNMKQSIRCTNKFKLIRCDGKRVCNQHKKIHTRKCREDGCKIMPNFGTEKNKGLYCDAHKKEGMRDVVNKTCLEDGCEKQPYFGSHLTGRIHCSNHRNKETEFKVTNCKTSKCRRISTHSETGSRPFLYCDNHSPSDYRSELTSTCISCNLTELICDEEGKCLLACSLVHLTRMKYTENKMMDFLTSKKLQFVNDRTASDGCSKKRPDFVFQTNYGVIIVENDENQHKSYACECEQMRMMTIHQDCGENVHFIRFNPDKYSFRESKTNECIDLDKRYKLLFGILKPILKYPESFFANHIGLTVRYMFYDNCNDQFEIQTINY